MLVEKFRKNPQFCSGGWLFSYFRNRKLYKISCLLQNNPPERVNVLCFFITDSGATTRVQIILKVILSIKKKVGYFVPSELQNYTKK